MIVNSQMSKNNEVYLVDSKNISEIQDALERVLYVPDICLKPYIIREIIAYIASKFSIRDYQIKVYIAYKGSNVCGYVSTEIHPGYTSRNRKSATLGWLHANSFKTCKMLIDACESFARKNNMKLIRGNLNFPKELGGMGIQEFGFEERMLYGVPFNDPSSKITEYLQKLGYRRDAEYVCMEVTHNEWRMGKKLDKNIKIRYLTPEDLVRRDEEIISLIGNAFIGVLPDSSGGNKYYDVMELFASVPQSHNLPLYDPRETSDQPEFIEAWESCNLKKINSFVHIAFTRDTDEVVGIIFCLPDKYQILLDEPITRVNVDTVLVKKGYGRKGIFSSLNNIGQLTGNAYGVTYYEGTGIWMVNEDAVRTILPHGRINRRFFVWQKRLKKSS